MTPPLAIALGDPAGIGPEIVAKAWEKRDALNIRPFLAIGDSDAVAAVWRGPWRTITDPAEAGSCFSNALPILQVGGGAGVIPGQPSLAGAQTALDSLEVALGLTRSGAAAALVTGPVSKAQLYAVGFTYPGQTEFVAERCGVAPEMVAMMLAGPTLKTVPITTHIPYRDVPQNLCTELIVVKARTTIKGLQRQFGLVQPRLAIAGLNPHAGEGGALGREEIELVIPAIVRLLEEGFDVTGPHSPDIMFQDRMRATYDAALCLYHDQALIPLKTLHFDEGVNMTLGLPIVRTSPDHGTAFAIAGKNMAEPGAMIAALTMASACAERIAQG